MSGKQRMVCIVWDFRFILYGRHIVVGVRFAAQQIRSRWAWCGLCTNRNSILIIPLHFVLHFIFHYSYCWIECGTVWMVQSGQVDVWFQFDARISFTQAWAHIYNANANTTHKESWHHVEFNQVPRDCGNQQFNFMSICTSSDFLPVWISLPILSVNWQFDVCARGLRCQRFPGTDNRRHLDALFNSHFDILFSSVQLNRSSSVVVVSLHQLVV